MPNLDGGHYFLTVLAPVLQGNMIDPLTGQSRSHRHLLAQELALLPTGRQTADSSPNAPPSPFASVPHNHFARFVVIDGPAYNGRSSGDALLNLNVNPLIPQPVDMLATPFLLFGADIDAQNIDGDTALRRYTDAFWANRAGFGTIFEHCYGFDKVTDAAGFYDYIVRCRIETTMPFNDYWAQNLEAPTAPIKPVLLLAAAAIVASGVAVWRVLAWAAVFKLILIVAIALIVVYGVYRALLAWGAKPFPTAPDSDLPSVLKALYLQQAFTRFATDAQGFDDAALYAGFGAFLTKARPGEATPALPPGEVDARRAELAA